MNKYLKLARLASQGKLMSVKEATATLERLEKTYNIKLLDLNWDRRKATMMTPEQKLQHMAFKIEADWAGKELPVITEDTIGDMVDEEYPIDELEEIRGGQVDTDIEPEYSRHYESKSVAMQMLDGSWVGWTYFYGGGKHGQPEGVDWTDKAYELTYVEEEQVVTVRTFTKVENK